MVHNGDFALQLLEDFIASQNVAIQYVPLDNHCPNAAEQTITAIVWNHHSNEGWSIVLISYGVITPILFWTFNQVNPHHLTMGFIYGFLTVPIWKILMHNTCCTFMASEAMKYKVTALIIISPLV